MSQNVDNSKILLLCLGTEKSNRKPRDISIADIHDVFSRFGDLNKILIFAKTTIFKAFLEFEDAEGSRTAQTSLHNSILPKLGHIKLYYSGQEKLESSNKFVDFWEKSVDKLEMKEDDIFTHSSSGSRRLKAQETINFYPKGKLCDIALRSAKIDYNFSIDMSESPKHKDLKSRSIFTKPKKIVLSKGSEFKMKPEFGGTLSTMDINPNHEEIKTQPSKVVLVSNLDHVFSSVHELFNLFSCFGDINKLILMHNLQKALVEYQSVVSAKHSIEHLSGLDIVKTRIKVNYSKYPKIDIKKSFRNDVSLQFNEVLTVPSSLNRYGEGKSPDIKSISSKLLFEVDKKDNLKMLDIYFNVEKFAEPQSIEALESTNQSTMQLLLTFKDKATACTIMSKFHRSDIKSAKVSISFYC